MSGPRDLTVALAELGVTVHRDSGDEVWALCPMHEERTGKADRHPSWSINRDSTLHKCFSCGYSGTLVDLILDLTDLDVFAAWRWIRNHGVRVRTSEEILTLRYDRATQPSEPVVVEQELEISEASLSLFFRPPPEVAAERNLSMESLDRYDLLWDVHEHGWIIPVRLPDTTLLGWQFKNKRNFFNYPRGMEKGLCLFGLELLEEGQTAVVVESPLDTCRIYDAGVDPGVAVPVATFGAEVTDQQVRALLDRTDSVIWALDNDTAGRDATQRIAMGVEKHGKVTREGWQAQFRDFRVYNYSGVRRKDPGEQTDEEIWFGIRNALTPAALRMGRYKDRSKHGQPESVPDKRHRQNGSRGSHRDSRDNLRGAQQRRNSGRAGAVARVLRRR